MTRRFLNKAIVNALHPVGAPRTKRLFHISGTDTSRGSRDLEEVTELAYTIEEAWKQAEAHAAGTSFTPETIEAA